MCEIERGYSPTCLPSLTHFATQHYSHPDPTSVGVNRVRALFHLENLSCIRM